MFGTDQDAANYTYDAAGDLVTATLAPANNAGQAIFHAYVRAASLAHHRRSARQPARTSTYYPDGRLQSDKDALEQRNDLRVRPGDADDQDDVPDSPVKGIVVQTFDARGLLLSETDQLGHTTTHEYDANRNETKRENALDEETIATYDDHGNQTSVTDPTGTTHTTYGDDNLPTTFTDRLGHVTTIEYDDRDVPKRFADELGTRFRFTSSEQGLPLTIDDAEGHRAYLNYDVAGNVTSRTDWLGRETRATYDEGGRRVTETSARGGVSTKNYFFGFGRLATTIEPNEHQVGYRYDLNGNLWTEDDALTLHGQNVYTYDALNHVTQVLHWPEGTTVNYTRDFRGNPLTMTDENGHTTTYEYDLAGQLKKTTFADGTFTDANVRRVEPPRVRDRRARQHDDVRIRRGCGARTGDPRDRPAGPRDVTAYDATGRRTSVTDANGHTTSFVYDVRGHVTETHYADSTTTHESTTRAAAARR